MPYPNEHSARLRNPGEFKEKPDWAKGKGKFRRVADGVINGNVKVPKTADVIWGQLKSQSGKAASPQAIRFPVKNWTASQARKWLRNNKVKYIKFEPAAPKKDNDSMMIDSSIGILTKEEMKAIRTNWILCLDFLAVSRQKAAEYNITVTEAMKIVKKEQPELYIIFRGKYQ